MTLSVIALATALVLAPAKTRAPGVAGGFYPSDAKELARVVDALLVQAKPPAIDGALVALVAPHAGYMYSGGVAAHLYALLKGRKIERVVVISPSHRDAFGFAAVYDGDAYATPLGPVPVDTAFAARLAAGGGLVRLSAAGHSPQEHALEVQLPFLQRTLGTFKLVPVVMGSQSYEACRALGLALARLIQGPETLIVASSDLSHFHPYDEAVRLDRNTLTAIEEWDYLSMTRNFEARVWEACGGGPIVAAMMAAERLGAGQARLLKYANSGDVTGERGSVVGYGAMALVKAAGPASGPAPQFSLTDAQKDELLKLVRASVDTAVREHKLHEYRPSGAFAQERGAFVTLKKNGALRGCIGYAVPLKPLGVAVRDVAAFAAVQDNRFPPVSTAELPQLEYEVSVLSPLRRVLDVRQIQVGRHGLVIKRGSSEGLLLPQVAAEEHWDRTTFLQQACVKAGLPPGAWQEDGTDIFTFSAIVFPEHRPRPAPPAPRSRSTGPTRF